MILWGPPGVGKTTLARLMADAFNADFIAISAVLAGVKDIRDAVARAEATRQQYGRATILFVDEVHRFNKAQQDAFLPYVEQGLLTFIGATTENPSFEVNSALLSRAAVYVLEPLSPEDLGVLLDRAIALSPPPMVLDTAGARRGDRVRRRRRAARDQPGGATRGGRAYGGAHTDRPGVRGSHDRALDAPVRQGRRGVLRPDLRAAQGGARVGPRRVALLDVPDARRRRRPALRRSKNDPDGDRGYRPRRSARAAARARRGRDLRAAGLARRRAGARRVRDLSRVRGEEQRRLHGVFGGARVHPRGWHRGRFRCDCATRRRS